MQGDVEVPSEAALDGTHLGMLWWYLRGLLLPAGEVKKFHSSDFSPAGPLGCSWEPSHDALYTSAGCSPSLKDAGGGAMGEEWCLESCKLLLL